MSSANGSTGLNGLDSLARAMHRKEWPRRARRLPDYSDSFGCGCYPPEMCHPFGAHSAGEKDGYL